MQRDHAFHKVEENSLNTRFVSPGPYQTAGRTPYQDVLTACDHNPLPQQTQRGAYTGTPCGGVYTFGPSIRDSRMSSRTSLPILHIHGPQNPEKATSNSVVSIRGSTIIYNDRASTLGTCETLPSHSPPKGLSTPSEGKVTHSGGTLDRGSNLSEDISMITLPSFVEYERRDSIPTPPNPPIVEGIRSFPMSRRSSPFWPSRSHDKNTMAPTTPSLEKHLMDDFPSPSLSVPDRQPHPFHQTHSLPSQRAGVRGELAAPKSKSLAQAEGVKIIQLWTPEPAIQPETNHSGPDRLSPLRIPTHTHTFLGDYDSTLMTDKSHSHEKRDADAVPHGSPRLASLQLSQLGALQSLEGAPQSFSMNHAIEPSPSYQSPILGFFHSPRSYSNSDERPFRVTLRARSSISATPSPSAFPSPPDFPPGPRNKAPSIIDGHLTSGQTFPPAKLWEGNSVRGIETVSPNEGQTSTLLPDADASLPISPINPRSVLTRHLRLESMGRDEMLVRSRVSPRILRRLSRMPLGPRQMSDRPKSSRRTPQPPSL